MAGGNVPQKQPALGRLWLNDGSCARLRSEQRDHVWCYELMLNELPDGRALRMLNTIDEFTREFLSIKLKGSLYPDRKDHQRYFKTQVKDLRYKGQAFS